MSLILNQEDAPNPPRHDTSGFIYKGFSIYSMLSYLQKYSTKLSFNAVNAIEWHLYAHSEEHGEYDSTGTLSRIVSQAFEPHIEQAIADTRAAHKLWEETTKQLHKHKDIMECPLSR